MPDAPSSAGHHSQGGRGEPARPPRPTPPLPARYHSAGPGPAPSALLSSPPPSRLYPRTIDPAFLPHIRGLYAEPAEASRLPARERIAPARPHSLPASAPASPLSPPGSGGRPLGMAAPNQSLPPPPGARTHGHTTHTHTLGNGGGGTKGRGQAGGPGPTHGLEGRAPALSGGRAGQRGTHSRAGRAGGGRTAGEGRWRRPPVRMRRLCRGGGSSVHPGAAAGGARRAPLWSRQRNGNGAVGVWLRGSVCLRLPPPERAPVFPAVADSSLEEGLG